MNPRQNALLELKLAGIRNLEFEDFFAMFGEGRFEGIRSLYEDKLRASLSRFGQGYWDRRIKFFESRRRHFYFHGTSGAFARLLNVYVDRIVKLRPWVQAILDAQSVSEQRSIYETYIRDQLWTRPLRFFMNRDTTLSLLGVPKPQRDQVESQYEGGIVRFVQDCVDAVFGRIPLVDNYFWRVYIIGLF
jgi:S-adenosylmethionine-diacylglycerol 3-amino-3-carboxypropyl transferase